MHGLTAKGRMAEAAFGPRQGGQPGVASRSRAPAQAQEHGQGRGPLYMSYIQGREMGVTKRFEVQSSVRKVGAEVGLVLLQQHRQLQSGACHVLQHQLRISGIHLSPSTDQQHSRICPLSHCDCACRVHQGVHRQAALATGAACISIAAQAGAHPQSAG